MTKILLVEDDKSLREIYGVRLLAEGYDIVSAGDGEEALAMAIKDRPDLIISDVMMPKISGFDMLDILRSTTETKNIKVIMMTALSSEDQRARGEQLGADRYLVKSQVGIEDVVQTVHDVLGDAPQPAMSASFTSAPSGPRPTPPPAVPSRPAAPQPILNPVITPQAPAAAPLAPAPTEATEPSTLPQPTAPFSTARPTGFGIGDRVINPLPKEVQTGPDINSLLEKELGTEPVAPSAPDPLSAPAPVSQSQPASTDDTTTPVVAPSAPVFSTPTPSTPPTPLVTPDATAPAPSSPAPQSAAEPMLDFEETPRQNESAAPANPFLNQPPQPPTAS